jgi:predicted nucleic acid-binding protein
VILSFCEQRRWHNIAQFEIEHIPDNARRKKMELVSRLTDNVLRIDRATSSRAKALEKKGMQAFDALHLACAENGADVFLTVDDDLLNRASGIDDLQVEVRNPVTWLHEVMA